MASTAPKPRSDAAEHLKAVALRLFAEKGIDGVTVRQIAEAAGQKNHAVVGYYFGSKEALVRELIVDGARGSTNTVNALSRLSSGWKPLKSGDLANGLLAPMAEAGQQSAGVRLARAQQIVSSRW